MELRESFIWGAVIVAGTQAIIWLVICMVCLHAGKPLPYKMFRLTAVLSFCAVALAVLWTGWRAPPNRYGSPGQVETLGTVATDENVKADRDELRQDGEDLQNKGQQSLDEFRKRFLKGEE